MGARVARVMVNAVNLMILRMKSVWKAKEIVTKMMAVLGILCVGKITAETIIKMQALEKTAAENQVGSTELQHLQSSSFVTSPTQPQLKLNLIKP